MNQCKVRKGIRVYSVKDPCKANQNINATPCSSEALGCHDDGKSRMNYSNISLARPILEINTFL